MGVTARARALSSATLLAACLGGCQIVGATDVRTVSLRMRGSVPDAQVTIDDMSIGPLGYVVARGVALPPGQHRITVEHDGYFPWDKLVEASDQPIVLEVVLVPLPD